MASKYTKQLQIPEEFAPLLKDFTRDVLRQQKYTLTENEILAFAAKYFQDLVDKRDGKTDNNVVDNRPAYMKMSDEEISTFVQNIFREGDVDGNGCLDYKEFKRIFRNLSDHLDLTSADVQRILAEADENDDGKLEYQEFVPIALEIIQSLRAQEVYESEQNRRQSAAELQARDVLLHGMPKEQLVNLLSEIFRRSDQDNSGYLNRAEFMTCIRDAELGLTRKEINILMSHVDEDGDGKISYEEFVPICLKLLVQIFANELVEIPTDEAQLAEFFASLFESEDESGTGFLTASQLKQLLRTADLGLTRIQITAIMAEAEEDSNELVNYRSFATAVSSMVILMGEFQRKHDHVQKLQKYRDSEAYHIIYDLNRHELESALSSELTIRDADDTGILSRTQLNEAIQVGDKICWNIIDI